MNRAMPSVPGYVCWHRPAGDGETIGIQFVTCLHYGSHHFGEKGNQISSAMVVKAAGRPVEVSIIWSWAFVGMIVDGPRHLFKSEAVPRWFGCPDDNDAL
jgi:hypothetical protein